MTQGVIVKEGVHIPDASVCSLVTYDTQEGGFVESQDVKGEFFEKGVISYIPKNMTLTNQELVGSKIEDDNESDFDFGFAESEEDPTEGFQRDLLDIF
jgi:hypothetical protein